MCQFVKASGCVRVYRRIIRRAQSPGGFFLTMVGLPHLASELGVADVRGEVFEVVQ